MMRVCFIQYTNPAAYPPTIHAAEQILAVGGKPKLLGAQWKAVHALTPPKSLQDTCTLLAEPSNRLLRGLRFYAFVAWACYKALRTASGWHYCSDPRSTPVGLLLRMMGRRVIYHEHDAPISSPRTLTDRISLWCRARLCKKVTCIAPTQGRAEALQQAGAQKVLIVPNYPTLRDLQLCRDHLETLRPTSKTRIIYQGNIGLDKIPLTVIDALCMLQERHKVALEITGYETEGSRGVINKLRERATQQGGDPDIVSYQGPMPRYPQMLKWGCGAAAGLSIMPTDGRMVTTNTTSMAGASNKTFDYLCQGAKPICSDMKDWRSMFGDRALYCDPTDANSIARVLEQAINDQAQRIRAETMRADLHSAIASAWNYGAAFQPVIQLMQTHR